MKKIPQKKDKLPVDLLESLYASMLRIRIFEEKIAELYPEQEMKCPVHLCTGQEAIAAGVCAALEKKDYVFSNHRGHGHCIAKGASMKSIMAELYGKSTGCSSGKGGSMHLVDVENGILGTSAIVAGGIPMGVGAALSSVMKQDNRVTVIFFGDGAYDEGAFYESFNFASLKKLPVVFVCENNLYATYSPQSARQPGPDIFKNASAFSSEGVCVDGNDVSEVYLASKAAIDRARAGQGPTLIEARTYRWKGHVGPEEDHVKGLRPKEELDKWKANCPIKRLEGTLFATKSLSEVRLDKIRSSITRDVDEAVKFARESPFPGADEIMKDVNSGN